MPAINRRQNRSKQKIILAVLIPVVLLVILICLAVFIKSNKGTCDTNDCVQKVSELKNTMNLAVNPCDNFYEFVCGNILKDKNQKNFQVQLIERRKHNLLKLYRENIKDDDHKMVKIAKRLFRQCLSEEGTEDLTGIKDAIKKVGGWPLLNSSSQNEENKFEWVKATYKLRELGYPFSVFINVEANRVIEDKIYLEITRSGIQHENDIMTQYSETEAIGIMSAVAKLFGVQDENLATEEIKEVYEFRQRLPSYCKRKEKYTVDEFQQKYDQLKKAEFNWLQFINKLLGPQNVISGYDYVYFEDVTVLSEFIDLISTSSKRTVQNYMIWETIELQSPNLPKTVQNIMKYTRNDTREELCLEEIEKRLSPSPMAVLNARNELSAEERQEVQEIFLDMKSEFLYLFQKTNLTTEHEKKIIMEKASKCTLIYGLPGNYFNDKILDDMDVDLVDTNNANNFLDLLAQVNKNHQTMLFRQITFPDTYDREVYTTERYLFASYFSENNVLYLATEFAPYFKKETPRYIKYPKIGWLFDIFMAMILFGSHIEFSEKTRNQTEEMSECIKRQMPNYSKKMSGGGLGVSIAEKLSYETYQKWIDINGEEPNLPGLNYTLRQLFWITGTYCHVPGFNDGLEVYDEVYLYSNVTFALKMNNPYFLEDFNCPERSKVKCSRTL